MEFFAIMMGGVSTFGTQWAALAARQYLFGAISGYDHVSRKETKQMTIALEVNFNPFLKELHRILYHLAFDVEPKVQVNKKRDESAKDRRDDVTKKFGFVIRRRNNVISVARHCHRPGIEHNFMSPLKLGKLSFLAGRLKRREQSAFDANEEEELENDKIRWTSTLAMVEDVRRRHFAEDAMDTGSSGATSGDNVDSDAAPVDDIDYDYIIYIYINYTESDTGSVTDADYDSDIGFDLEAWLADVEPSASEAGGGGGSS